MSSRPITLNKQLDAPWTARSRVTDVIGAAIRLLLVLEAGTLLMAALLHTGAPIPLGPIVLAEPRIIPAIIAEGLCGLLLAVAACAFFARASWAWRAAAVGAHAFAIAGVLLGTFALAVGAGPRTELNDVYHRVILLALLAGLGLLLTPAGKWVLAS